MENILGTTGKVRAAVRAAKEKAEQAGVPLTVERLACELGISRAAVKAIAAGDSDACAGINEKAAAEVRRAYYESVASVMEWGLVKGSPQSVTVFNLKNNAEYTDKADHAAEVKQAVYFVGEDHIAD